MINKIIEMMKRILGILFLLFFTVLGVSAQTGTNKEALSQFAREKEIEWHKASERVAEYMQSVGITEKRIEFEDGTVIELMDVRDGIPVYFITDNINAAATTRANELWPGGGLGIEITGADFDRVGVWDGGAVRATHQEFNDTGVPRITLGDNASRSDHATHVAGTIIAGGVNAQAKGMAYEASLKSYDWNSVENEMATAAANGMIISNHSWGMITGWYHNGWSWVWYGDSGVSATEDYNFGYYSSMAQDWDKIAINAPSFLIVKSAGNDRGDGPSNAGSPGVAEKDGGEDGFDCISSVGVAKNVLTVGAVEKVLDYTGPESVVMSYFSGWGPADDGRIKPDVVADGVNVYSSTASSNTSYSSYSGTSMATPNTTGTLVLLHQYFQQLYDSTMKSSTLKGLVIHTADECGPAEGPDYMHGWGLVNAEKAARVIQETESLKTINEIMLKEGERYERKISIPGDSPLRVTICWIDPEGPVLTPALNNRTSVLINDLDLRIIDEEGNTYYPYKLDPENPEALATKDSKNSVDNVEHIYIETPQSGKYTVIVDHEGSLSGDPQLFSLIISGIDEYIMELPECTSLLIPQNSSNAVFVNQEITWQEVESATYYQIYFGTDGNGEELPTNIYDGIIMQENSLAYDMEPATTYYIAIHPGNQDGVNTECDIYNFTTYSVENVPFLEDVETTTVPELPSGWQVLDNKGGKWTTTNNAAYSGNNSFIYIGEDEVPGNMLVSPPIAVMAEKEYYLKLSYQDYQKQSGSLSVVWGGFPSADKLNNELSPITISEDSDWEEIYFPVIPVTDGYIYFGLYLKVNPEISLLVDDIELDDTPPVSIKEQTQQQINIRYETGNILLYCDEPGSKADVKVFNIVGQQLLETSVPDMQNGRIRFEAVPGIYIVNVRTEKINLAKKIIIY